MEHGKDATKRYTYWVAWDPRDDIYVARVAEFEGLAAHGDTKEEALRELKVAVQASIDWSLEEGDPVPEPMPNREFSGRVLLRLPRSLHRELVIGAAREGTSINQLAVMLLSSSLPGRSGNSAER